MVGRYLAVALLSMVAIAIWAPDVMRAFGHPLGTPGFVVGAGGRVLSVETGSPAQRAGILPGGRIDWAGTPLQSRVLIVASSLQTLHPIQHFTVREITSNRAFTADVASLPESSADIATVLPRMLLALILLVAGIALVLLRPSKAAWAFFIYALTAPSGPINVINWWGPPVYQIAALVFTSLAIPAVSLVAAIVFALNLLAPVPLRRWRRVVEQGTYLIAALAVAFTAWATAAAVFYGFSFEIPVTIALALEICAILAVPLILLATYVESDGAVRERLRWVLLGFSANAVISSVLFLTAQPLTFVAIPYWIYGIISGIANVLVASTVLYAVLKHHVMDVNIVISRAVVYTILSAVIVGVFALVDLFFSRELSARNTGLIVDMGLALMLGFFFNSMHRYVDRLVDELLFKRRHAAEQHLRTVIRAMPFAVSERQVDTIVTEEPVQWFGLRGAALLARDEHGDFTLSCATGLAIGPSELSREDPLPMYLKGQRGALRLSDTRWCAHALAVSVYSHGELAAIIFYGAHQSGTDFDAGETSLFEELAAAAGNAYDRLETVRLRQSVIDLNARLEAALRGAAPDRIARAKH